MDTRLMGKKCSSCDHCVYHNIEYIEVKRRELAHKLWEEWRIMQGENNG